MAAVKIRWWLVAADWGAVWLVVFISVALSTFLVDPSQFEVADRWTLAARAALLATFVTAFYASVTWLRRPGSTVPEDIRDRLPDDPPGNPLEGGAGAND